MTGTRQHTSRAGRSPVPASGSWRAASRLGAPKEAVPAASAIAPAAEGPATALAGRVGAPRAGVLMKSSESSYRLPDDVPRSSPAAQPCEPDGAPPGRHRAGGCGGRSRRHRHGPATRGLRVALLRRRGRSAARAGRGRSGVAARTRARRRRDSGGGRVVVGARHRRRRRRRSSRSGRLGDHSPADGARASLRRRRAAGARRGRRQLRRPRGSAASHGGGRGRSTRAMAGPGGGHDDVARRLSRRRRTGRHVQRSPGRNGLRSRDHHGRGNPPARGPRGCTPTVARPSRSRSAGRRPPRS